MTARLGLRVATLLALVLRTPVSLAAQQAPTPNELGRIPILEYHLIGDSDKRWARSRASFRRDLEQLYAAGYRPITVGDLVARRIDLPAGRSPVVFTFDDASPGQFRYVRRNGALVPDPTSAIGIWLDFAATHPEWTPRATFCLLSNADHGHAFFGNKGIDGQETAWRFQKLQWLVTQGFELCNHTLYHVKLNRVDDDVVREQIGRAQLAIDSAVAGYRVRTFALPLGLWPRDRSLARRGTWTDATSGARVQWTHEAVLEVGDTPQAGSFSFSPHDPRFDAGSLPRYQIFANRTETLIARLATTRYVSDGNPRVVTRGPAVTASARPRPTARPRGGRGGS
ncbi:MAG: polysaccharide deacetylase family protein [Gemmatimonadaceae bacterium]|nr:polysaccharide deacetylase family protein [Gemmatimonadaceae bacterium]